MPLTSPTTTTTTTATSTTGKSAAAAAGDTATVTLPALLVRLRRRCSAATSNGWGAPPDGTAVDICSNQSAGGFAGCYRRDFDLLGYKYSLLAQTATAGLNAVFTMLPARDEREFALFPAQDVAFIRRWLAFGDARVEQLCVGAEQRWQGLRSVTPSPHAAGAQRLTQLRVGPRVPQR